MSNKPLKLTVAQELRERLEAISVQLGRSVQETADLALAEFVENWEDYLLKLGTLDSELEKRAILQAVHD